MSKSLLYTLSFLLSLSCGQVLASDGGKEEADQTPSKALVPVTHAPRNQLNLLRVGDGLKGSQFAPVTRDVRELVMRHLDGSSARAFGSTCTVLRNDYVHLCGLLYNGWIRGGRINEHGVVKPAKEWRTARLLPLMYPAMLSQLAERAAQHVDPRVVDYRKGEVVQDGVVSQNEELQDLVNFAAQSPEVSKELCQHVLNMDPGNFRMVLVAAALVAKRPELKDELVKAVKDFHCSQIMARSNGLYENMDPAEAEKYMTMFPLDLGENLVGSLREVKGINRLLMAAKLLALNGNQTGKNILNLFTEQFRSIVLEGFAEHLALCPEQPLWVLYASEVEAISEYCHLLSVINDRGTLRRSLRNARAMADYLKSIPVEHLTQDQQAAWREDHVKAVSSDCIYQDYQGNPDASIAAEKEVLGLVDATNVREVTNLTGIGLGTKAKIEKILSGDSEVIANQNKAIELILGLFHDDNVDGADSWAIFRLKENMANHILLMGDPNRLEVVESYLKFVQKSGFEDGQNYDEEDEDAQFNEESSLHRPKLALALYRGDFKTVLECVKHINMFKPFILIAMKRAVNVDMPEDVAEALGQLIEKTFVHLEEEDKRAGEDSFDDKGMVMMVRAIFDDAFCAKYLKNQPETMAKVKAILARK